MKFPPRAKYSKSEIDRAGEIARLSKPGSKQYIESVAKINEWRISHHYPMHTFNITLRKKAYDIDKDAIVARRLKRLQTILDKVGSRQLTMKLSRMQDIGGVRAVMKNTKQVYQLAAQYTDKKRFTHKLKPVKDYIQHPKPSGYRGVHLVFEFNNAQGRTPHARDYDGLNIEVQVRTQLQHIWATAVEAIGMMRHEELKSSSGNKQWLEFFGLMSSIIALLEDSPVLETHQNLSSREIIDRTYHHIKELGVENIMSGWAVGMKFATNVDILRRIGQHYVIISLDSSEGHTSLYRYKEDELDQANQKLTELEAIAAVSGNPDPVLVSVGDIKNLQRAYPNYFFDIRQFLDLVSYVVRTVEDAV